MSRWALRLAAALGVALLAACSATRVAYDHADTLLHWQATRYVELRGPASDELDRRIDAFLAWHREKALPQYEKIAREASRRLERGLSPADMVWGYDTFVGQGRESLRAAAEQLAPLLDRLNAEQLAHLEQQFAEDNRKFARENLRGSEKDRRKRRAKRNVERLEDWVGTLSAAQLERVRQYSERAPLYDELRERDHKRLQAQLLGMLRAREAGKRLADAATYPDRGREPAYVAAVEAHRKEYLSLVLDIERMLSPEQRARAVSRLRGFADDFAALAGETRRRR